MIRIPTLAFSIALFINYGAAQTMEAGKRQYLARCVTCHGEDGSGGRHGPNIVDVQRPRATSQEAVRTLILKGIPDGGMPAFRISDEEAGAIAAYVMRLKQPASGGAAPGDSIAGERFFAAKGKCAGCHMVRGRGAVIGPDLSNVGRDRTPVQIEQALRDPGAAATAQAGRGRRGAAAPSYRAVTVRLRNSQTIRGIAKNESAFDVQLLDLDGKLHLLLKDQVAEVIREKSLMPK